jgi:hypothetical protein
MEDVRIITVLEAKASRTRESACETWEKSSKTLIDLVTDSWAIPSESSRRIDRREEDRGSKIPSLTNIRQKSLRGVGDWSSARSTVVLIAYLEFKDCSYTLERGKDEGTIDRIVFIQ